MQKLLCLHDKFACFVADSDDDAFAVEVERSQVDRLCVAFYKLRVQLLACDAIDFHREIFGIENMHSLVSCHLYHYFLLIRFLQLFFHGRLIR